LERGGRRDRSALLSHEHHWPLVFARAISALTATVAVAGTAYWRIRRFREISAGVLSRRRLGPDGVVIGGGAFELRRDGAPAVLLLHGAGDTPQTLRYLGDALYARGFHVSAPLLPGHGRSLRDFAAVTANKLTSAAFAAYAELRESHEWVSVIGLSMGGALAVQLSAVRGDLPALGLVAPYLAMPRKLERLARYSRVWGLLVPAGRSNESTSVLDASERALNLAYGVFTPSALRALRETMRRAVAVLPRVVSPTLMIQSREDNRIEADAAERAFARIGSREKHLEWITGAAHIITVDYGREQVIARLVSFMEAHLRRPLRVDTH
jgi:carboxylesterase